MNRHVFKPSIIDCKLRKESLTNISGKLYPPRKRQAVIQLNNTIELYSALNSYNRLLKNPALLIIHRPELYIQLYKSIFILIITFLS